MLASSSSQSIFALLLLLGSLVLLSSTAIAQQSRSQTWAILVAGSNGYFNYRHQSDVYHAFHLLRRNGIPESNIIVMHEDDIANNPSNPHNGTVINFQGGEDVYQGVPKDYTGPLVTTANLQRILRGENMTGIGTGKSLQSGPNDNIFLYYTNHGAEGLVAMPHGGYLYAKDLLETLKYMRQNNKYNRMVIYLEACESGSMFNGVLPTDWNVFAHTASNPTESSYACDWSADYKAYLNDCWSRNWLNSTLLHLGKLNEFTIGQQYDEVQKMTKESPACKYGDMSLEKYSVGMFQGSSTLLNMYPGKRPSGPLARTNSFVSSRQVKEQTLRNLVASANSESEREKYAQELNRHLSLVSMLDLVWNTFAERLKIDLDVDEKQKKDNKPDESCTKGALKMADLECIKDITQAAVRACGEDVMYSEENWSYMKYLSGACKQGVRVHEATAVLGQICRVAFPARTKV